MSDEFTSNNIRELLGTLIGKRVVDITQHDKEELEETGTAFVMLMFEDGSYLKFPIGEDGFHGFYPDGINAV